MILFLEIVVVYLGLTRDRTEITVEVVVGGGGRKRGVNLVREERTPGTTKKAYSFLDTEFRSCSLSSCDAMLLLVFLNSLL